MQHIQDLETFSETLRGGVIALGNFDGVHRGHTGLLSEAVRLGKSIGAPVGVMTFDPHPREFFNPDAPIFPLTPGALKADALAGLGVDFLWTATFDQAFSQLTAEEFVLHYLVEQAAARHVVAGFNFHFGKGRGGSPDVLKTLGSAHGFDVSIVEPRKHEGEAVSSSAIRADLKAGRVREAADKLGRPWVVRGTVISGAQLGTELGFPTANVTLDPRQDLHHGIYAVRILIGRQTYTGAAYFGRRPTFDNGKPVLEVFLFDFDGDLYGKEIDISFVSFIREDAVFADGHDLALQMEKDCDAARAALAASS